MGKKRKEEKTFSGPAWLCEMVYSTLHILTLVNKYPDPCVYNSPYFCSACCRWLYLGHGLSWYAEVSRNQFPCSFCVQFSARKGVCTDMLKKMEDRGGRREAKLPRQVHRRWWSEEGELPLFATARQSHKEGEKPGLGIVLIWDRAKNIHPHQRLQPIRTDL